MIPPRASLVIAGQIVVAARSDALETAEAIGIADGRVVSAGTRQEVLDAAAGARVVDVRGSAVIPGIHDFHLHLVGMARARRTISLEGAASHADLVDRVRIAANAAAPDAWLLGRGWAEECLDRSALHLLEAAVGHRRALLTSHDGHSAWASAAARRLAGLSASTPDPAGGRAERDAHGVPDGVLRERAMAPLVGIAAQLSGPMLAGPLGEVLDELASFGITGATDAGDAEVAHGVGAFAELGDSFTNLLAAELGGRLRLTIDLPVAAIDAAATRGLHSGQPLDALRRVGWAKLYADGALGSRTAALFAPYSCGGDGGAGILRVAPGQLDERLAVARSAGIGLAIHAIGDRAVAEVLDAYARAPSRRLNAIPDRLEHAQLVREADRPRFAAGDITASMQPVHCPSDRAAAEACWAGRLDQAYAWRSLLGAGARLAFGSDAPIEPADPWLGMFAAVHRRYPGETEDWRPAEALDVVAALSAYTLAPAIAMRRPDEGHLRPGARADLAVLDTDLATLLAGDERLAAIRSQLTMVAGEETHRS